MMQTTEADTAPTVKTEAEQVRDCFGVGRLSPAGKQLLDEALRLHSLFTRAEIQKLLDGG